MKNSVEKQFFFLCGLPRSGSTILQSILNQNSKIYCTATSPLLDLLEYNEYHWVNNNSVIANPIPNKNLEISRAVINGCWEHVPQNIIIDKCRGWVKNIPVLRTVFNKDPKIILTVRDIPSVLASYLSILRKQKTLTYVDEEIRKKGYWLNDRNRVDYIWNTHVQLVVEWSRAAYVNFPNNLFIINYDDLVNKDKINSIVEKLYNFLELPLYKHQYTNIKNDIIENDEETWRIKGLHTIRENLLKISQPPEIILGEEIYNKYKKINFEFWHHG